MGYQETKVTDAIRLTDYENKPMEAFYIDSKRIDTKFGEQMIHNFEKEDGKKVSVWGFSALNRLLEFTPKGILCKVTYTGKAEEPNKYGNRSHTCTVWYDIDKKLDGFKEIEPEVDSGDDLPF